MMVGIITAVHTEPWNGLTCSRGALQNIWRSAKTS